MNQVIQNKISETQQYWINELKDIDILYMNRVEGTKYEIFYIKDGEIKKI